MRNKAVKKVLSVILTVCLTLALAPFGASAQETPLDTNEEIVDSGALPDLPDTGSEPQFSPTTPSDLPQSLPLDVSGLDGVGPLAAATATARVIVGYQYLYVRLTGGVFAANPALNHNQWTLSVPEGMTIQGISRMNDTTVLFALSAAVSPGDAFTIDSVDSSQFASGTTAFEMSLAVEVKTPAPAVGGATADADTRDILVTLTGGEFNATQLLSYWTLGGASAASHAISSISYLDVSKVKITLNDDIGPSDVLTITSTAGAFLDVSTWPFTAPLPVTVSTPAVACSIGTTGYPSLTAALAAVKNGETIKLLGHITHTSPIVVDNMEITFDPNGYDLFIDTSATENATALKVGIGGNVGYNTPGTFTVCGGENGYGVLAQYGGRAAVSGILIKTDYTEGAYATGNDSRITVNGDIKTVGAEDARYARVVGAAAGMEAKVTVNGSLSIAGDNAVGAAALLGGEVQVNPPGGGTGVFVKGDHSVGIETRNDPQSKVTVNGGVEVQGNSATGVAASFGQVTVERVTVAGNDSFGAHAVDYGLITIKGNVNVTGNGVNGVRSETGEGAGGTVKVTGNILIAGGTSETTIGISCSSRETAGDKSAVTVDGTVTAPLFLELDGQVRDKEPPDGADGIYAVYTGRYGSVVKVGDSPGPSLPTVTTALVSPMEVTTTGAQVRGGVTATGGAEITTFGFAWGLHADPTTANSTAAGTGTAASFEADLSGLVPNQTYYVRAYATNSAGTAYGENRTFTTAASDPLAAPLNLRYLAHDGAVELMWDAPPSASPIVRYEILRGNDLTQLWTEVGDVTSYRVTGLTNGENHFFNIRAVNAEGPGAHGFLWVMANIPTPPGPPHSLSASGYNGTIRFSWNTPYGNGYREITGYLVSTDHAGWIDVGRDRSYNFTGLTNGTTYTFYVRAVNAIGAGEVASVQGTPRSSGGGSTGTAPSGGQSAPRHRATVKGSGTPPSLPISTHTGTGRATVNLASIAETIPQVEETIVTLPAISGIHSYTIEFPASILGNAGDHRLTIHTPQGDVTIPDHMLTGTGISGNIGLIIGKANQSDLPDIPEDIKAAMGNRPLISLLLTVDGKQVSWSNPDGPVQISLPYTPTQEELQNPESIVVWYIDGTGNVVCVPNGQYDPATGTVTFTVTHFSYYGVGYHPVRFRDVVSDAWYARPVGFIAARGITENIVSRLFIPDAKLTRGQFIVMLMRAYGIAPDANPTDNFSDAGSTYYTGYLAAAKGLGIAKGIGSNLYAPDKEITRQEMFTLIYNALEVINQLPQGHSSKTLDHFSDAGQIEPWAKDAMTLLVETGTIQGNDSKLLPRDTMTRAQLAQVLYNLLTK